ncbi:MAG: sel1 repeat family protein [Pseudomonadota bacterium]
MLLPGDIEWSKADNETLFDMSLKYANGEGVESNYVIAHIFLNIASSRGCQRSVEYRKELAFDMDQKDIAKAQKIARELLFGSKTKPN